MCMEDAAMGSRTNIVLDEALLDELREMTAIRTKKDVVELALRELLKKLKRKKLLAARGSGFWEGNLEERRKQRVDPD